jgi:hypothetical protein
MSSPSARSASARKAAWFDAGDAAQLALRAAVRRLTQAGFRAGGTEVTKRGLLYQGEGAANLRG